jgi:hypothetical protein
MIALTGWLLLVHLTEMAGWGCLFLEGLIPAAVANSNKSLKRCWR